MSMWFPSFLKNVTRPFHVVIVVLFFLLLIYFAYTNVSPFVLSFLAHSLSKGNLQQLQFRESKERQQINRSPTNTSYSPEAKVTGREFSSNQDR